jgi:hypothetical protein
MADAIVFDRAQSQFVDRAQERWSPDAIAVPASASWRRNAAAPVQNTFAAAFRDTLSHSFHFHPYFQSTRWTF